MRHLEPVVAERDNTMAPPRCSAPLKQAMLALLPNLRAFAHSLCGDADRADDLVQDTLLRAWSNIGSFQEGTNLKAWLFTILRNLYFSSFRKRRYEVADSEGERAARLAVMPAQQGHVDLADFRRALDQLPPDQREALILIGAAGFSYEEAAEICGCAIGTVKSRVNRARAKMVQLLSLERGEELASEPLFEAIVAQGGQRVVRAAG